MRIFILFLFCFAFQFGWAQSVETRKADSLFANAANSNKPGGVVYVLKDGAIVYRKAIGLADIEKEIPNSFDLKYDLASIAKQFTAMCIALLEEQGKISSEDLLSKYYPEFELPNEIRVKNLIDHTSGIREAYVLATLSGKTNLKGELRQKYNTKAHLLEALKRERDLNFQPGTELAYTNINYILLADIVERISRQPFHRFADSAIFKPLKMNNTFYRTELNMEFPGEAKGYLVKGKKYKAQKGHGGILGDGKMVSTADDLVKWEQNFLHNRLGKGDQSLVDKLYTSSKLNNGELTQYGYGLWNREYRGLKTISHGGDDGRFTSFILKFPDQGFAIICLANSSLYANTESTAYQLANIFLASEFLKPTERPSDYNFISLPEAAVLPLAGVYKRVAENGLAQLRKVSVIKGNVFVSASYHYGGTMAKPVNENFFVLTNRAGSQVTFKFEKDGVGAYFDEQFKTNKPFRFDQVKPVRIDARSLRGNYVNKSTDVRLKVKSKRQKLVAKKGVIKIPLLALGEDQFYATANDALFIFQRDASGKIISLKVNASDFRNFIFEKKK